MFRTRDGARVSELPAGTYWGLDTVFSPVALTRDGLVDRLPPDVTSAAADAATLAGGAQVWRQIRQRW